MTDRIDALERLAKLKADGALSEMEFASQKAKILGEQASQQAPALSERWREGRTKTHGTRRFFRWFWGIQMLFIVCIGIYFLTAGSKEEARRSVIADEAPAAAVPQTREPAQPLQTVEITDATLTDPWNYDGDGGKNSHMDVCASRQVTIANQSTRTLHLELYDLATVEAQGTIPDLVAGESRLFSVGKVGEYVISNSAEAGQVATTLFLLNAVKCSSDE
ncbi:SHOCT domain-containing protein [Sphingobium sp. D43FB]|uniref:SHOCT domain-containing protein n=1 Tax=Sphingobium sp. D43FB TaxID=2017595 RepID=UPI000BB55B4A|nr:SHOCT domain-containing protein [Sphingobium sp. D43FB]PBN43792.1 hypothetical protein SxD43FB_08635 [Sphingobium sp. D43FB]